MSKTSDNFNHINQIMQRVSGCPWSTFKLHEIVTLQKCLQEVSMQDPQFNLIVRKLATETIFVEPSERLKHINRSKQDELSDIEFRRRSQQLIGQVETLGEEIQYYASRLNELDEVEEAMSLQERELERSNVTLRGVCELRTDELSLLLQRVYDSFDSSLEIARQQLPEYVRAASQSKLVKQTDEFPEQFRRSLLKLTRKHQAAPGGQSPTQAMVLNFKRLATRHVNSYLKAQAVLYRDLSLICSLYSEVIPDELGLVGALDQHLSHLKQPIAQLPRRVVHVHHHHHHQLQQQQQQREGEDTETDMDLGNARLLESSPPEAPNLTDDLELSRMFGLVARLCKSNSFAGATPVALANLPTRPQ